MVYICYKTRVDMNFCENHIAARDQSHHRIVTLRDGWRWEVFAKVPQPHEFVVISAQIVEELKEFARLARLGHAFVSR